MCTGNGERILCGKSEVKNWDMMGRYNIRGAYSMRRRDLPSNFVQIQLL